MKIVNHNLKADRPIATNRPIVTSANNKELAEKIKISSKVILKQRYSLYKSLEHK